MFFFSITWEKTSIESAPQLAKQKTRTLSERKWCVGLSSSVVSLSPGSQLNTRLSYTIQAAWLRVGGSGLQTMSNIREQSFCAIVTSTRVPKWKANSAFDTFANLHMNVAIFQDKLKAFYQVKYFTWPYRMYCAVTVDCVFHSRCKSNLHFDFWAGLALIWSTFHLFFLFFFFFF